MPERDQHQHGVHLRDVLDVARRGARDRERADEQLVEVPRLRRAST